MQNLVFIGSGMDGILWTTGSLVYSPTTNNLGELLAGPDGYVLKMTGGIPTWTSSVDTNLGNTDLISNANIRTYTLFGSTPSETLSFLNGDSLSILTLKGDRTIAFDGYTTNGFVKTGSGNGTLSISQQVASTEGGTGRSSWTANALPYISATNTFNEILAGTNGHVLTMVAGTPAWAALSVSLTSQVTGVLPIANGGTNLSALGSALQYLRVNSLGTALEYATLSAPNIYTASDTITDDARTVTLKTGTTATQNFQIKNSAGKVGYYFDGANNIGLKSSTFATIPGSGGGEFANFTLGDSTNMVTSTHYLTNTGAAQYFAHQIFSGSTRLQYIDARGGHYWVNTGNSNNDIEFRQYGNGARITLSTGDINTWGNFMSMSAEGNNNILFRAAGSSTAGKGGVIEIYNGTGGAVKTVLTGNRSQVEAVWFADGLVLGGTRGRSATPFFDVMGPGSTSATTTALFQNSSAVTSLELKDDLSVNIGTSGTGSTTNFYLPTGNTGMNIYSLSGVKMLAVSSNSRRFNFLTPNQSTALEVNVNADVNPFMRVQNDGWQLIYKPSSGAYEAMNLSMAGAYPFLNMRDAVNSSTVNIVGGNSSNFLYSMTIGSMAATNASCLLELVSTTKGFGLPSMTTAQKNAISTPIAGLVVYDSSLTSPYYYNGSAWSSFSGISGTTNYVARYTGTTTLGTGIIQDNGSRVGINSSPQSNYKVYIDSDEIVGLQVVNNAPSGSNNFGLAGSATNSNTASNVGVFGNALLSSGGTNLGVRGQSASQAITASNSIVAAGSNIGGFFQANESSGTAYGLVSSADSTSNQASATFIGALIRADNAGTKYAVQLIDGTESAGKFLKSITSDGKANWANITYSDITNSTSLAIGVGSIELGNASDTTISRSSSGVIAVEGVVIPSVSSTNTLTNKRITQRTGSTTSSATPTINTDNVDFYELTAQAVDITSFTTNLSGTPTKAQKLWISITGTAARAITWGASFEASTIALPTTTVSTNRLDVGFIWNDVTNKWRCVGSV